MSRLQTPTGCTTAAVAPIIRLLSPCVPGISVRSPDLPAPDTPVNTADTRHPTRPSQLSSTSTNQLCAFV